MAKKQSNTLVWLGLIGVVGYMWYTNKGTTTTTPGATSLPSLPANQDTAGSPTDLQPVANPVNAAAVISSPTQTISTATASALPPTTPQTVNAETLPAGISQLVYNTVYTWAYADGRIPVKAMANALVPSEYAGMYDIIVNQWGKNQPATTAQKNFWNDLRTKYDPTHTQW